MNELTERLLRAIGVLMLRIGAAVLMMSHGWGKVQMVLEGRWAEFKGDPIGLGNGLSLVAAAGAEFFCALLVGLGLFTRAAAAPVVFTMLVAAFVVHANDDFGTKEKAIVYALMFVVIMFTGGGRFSLDSLLWPALKRRRERRKILKKQGA
jgi:putative oxidoreductase